MVCQWCGVYNDGGNHQTLAECVEALSREVEMLRAALDERKKLLPHSAAPEQRGGKKPWRFRRG